MSLYELPLVLTLEGVALERRILRPSAGLLEAAGKEFGFWDLVLALEPTGATG